MSAGGYEDAPATRMLATHCACCGRPLVDAVSVEAGVGPDCRRRYGYGEAQGAPAWAEVLRETDGLLSVGELLGDDPGAAEALNAGAPAWGLGGAETRRVANKVVHLVACLREGPEVPPLVRALRALGFVRLADRVAERVAAVRVEVEGGLILVRGPYSEGAAGVMRRARADAGGRWDRERGCSVFPERARRVVHEALRRAYPGAVALGPKGLFVLA